MSTVHTPGPREAARRYTVAASGIRGVLAYAGARRVPVDGVLAAAGLAEEDLAGPEARVPQEVADAVFAALAERANDPDFGLHFAERLDIDALDVVGHLAVKSATVGEGLDRVCAHSRILHDSGRVDLERRGREAVLYPGCRGLVHEYQRHIAEFATLAAVVLPRMVSGVHVVPTAVFFKHPAPARTTEHLRLFGIVPTFGASETSLVFDAAVLDLRVLSPQPGLITYLDAYARGVLSRLPDDGGLVAQVERAVTTAMERAVPDIETVAARLGLSARTLQRRLGDESTTFQEIVERARRTFAERYLEEDRLSVAEVAFLTGFADPSNFHRAFRRWTGVTPNAYRAAHGKRRSATTG